MRLINLPSFKSLEFKYGLNNKFDNTYDSKTGRYQYVNNHDSIVVKTVYLSKDDLLYLHRKAAELGFWDFPREILADSINREHPSLRYDIEFNYKRKSKNVLFDEAFERDPKLQDAAMQMVKQIQARLADAENRLK